MSTATPTDQPKPIPLTSPTRLLVALAGVAATTTRPSPSSDKWLNALCKATEIDPLQLPSAIETERVEASAADQRDEWTVPERERIASILVEAGLAAEADGKETVRYSPWARAYAHGVLRLLGLDTALLPRAEKKLGDTLFAALKGAEDKEKDKVESTRQKHAEGWGGSFGRKLATGAGVIAGGVLLGVTGGLAAPAIAAVLAPLGIGGILGAGAAPVVLGTLFGVGGGGLAGRRVRERWRGVEEFSFVEVGAGTEVTKEEAEAFGEARERYKVRVRKPRVSGEVRPEGEKMGQEAEKETVKRTDNAEETAEKTEKTAEEEETARREEMEDKLLHLSVAQSPKASADRPTLDAPADEAKLKTAPHPPSLTATIVVPGLLTVSPTEAITAWRNICSTKPYLTQPTALSDGRDVYLLRYETALMLKTGRDIDHWVTSKLKGKLKAEIIKRTLLNAYFAAVSLPLTVYSMASMSLDNTWMHAQDRASKAGRILGEVLEQRVQGERPVVLIGSSLGALTILKALLYLAEKKGEYVESAYLISLPSAPTADEWKACRGVVARRLVNAHSGADWVLAGVVRLHEVISRAATLNSGVSPAGLGPVEQPGVEDVDVSEAVHGHMELQAKMGEVLEIIQVDA